MTKQEFFKFIDCVLEGETLENKQRLLEWVVEEELLQEYEERLLKGYKKCNHCKKYFKESDIKPTVTELVIKDQALYKGKPVTAENLYSYIYKKCPYCNRFVFDRLKFIKCLSAYDKKGKAVPFDKL